MASTWVRARRPPCEAMRRLLCGNLQERLSFLRLREAAGPLADRLRCGVGERIVSGPARLSAKAEASSGGVTPRILWPHRRPHSHSPPPRG